MDDRELLEGAARAAGIKIEWVSTRLDDNFTARIRNENPYWFNWPAWNPLDDDGDALRLAVKLGLDIDIHRRSPLSDSCGTEVRGFTYRRNMVTEPASDNDESLEAATRRAIVRAAAEIGKKVDAPLVRAD